MKTPITHLPPDRAPRMIDLTRSLKFPHGSLSPNCETEPRWRIESREDANYTAHIAAYAGLCFFAFVAITFAAAMLGWL